MLPGVGVQSCGIFLGRVVCVGSILTPLVKVLIILQDPDIVR